MRSHPSRSSGRGERRLATAVVAAVAAAALAVVTAPRLGAVADAARDVVGEAPQGPPATAIDPGMADALERARRAAAAAGVDLAVASGFRTAAEQAALLEAEVAARGSVEEAERWVFPPERSMHVQGLAVDIANGPAADWLLAEGARFGLCQTLGWEWWHFEWRARWEAAGSCPAPVTDPADAPPP